MSLGVGHVRAAPVAIDHTKDGPELHAAGLACIRTACASVMTADSVMRLDALSPRTSAPSPDRRSATA